MKKERFATPWKEYAARWKKYYTPPGQPSKQAVNTYRHFALIAISNLKRKPRGLILGSTPELRDLLAQLGFEVTLADINMEMILAMGELAKRKDPGEILINSNWLDIPIEDNYFDVIFGDIVLSNIPRPKQDNFLKELARLLKPGGHWISKMEFVPNDWVFEDCDAVAAKYSAIPESKSRAMELLCHLHYELWNRKSKKARLSDLRNWMEKYKAGKDRYRHPSKKITKYLNDIWSMWKPMEKQWDYGYESDVEKQVGKHFRILARQVLGDCYFYEVDKTYPIWFMKAKKIAHD